MELTFYSYPWGLKMVRAACIHASFWTFKAFLHQLLSEKHCRYAFVEICRKAQEAYT